MKAKKKSGIGLVTFNEWMREAIRKDKSYQEDRKRNSHRTW